MRLFGLIGYPLGHSRSADYFNARFSREGITDAQYRLFPIPALQELDTLLRTHTDLAGLNVTIPFKEAIIPILADIDETARDIGSVNVVLVSREDKSIRLKGFNTDAGGFLSAFPEPAHHRQALVLGTGGAAKAVAWALEKSGIRVVFVSRNPHSVAEIGYQALWESPGMIREHTLIINATPAGMFPHSDTFPPIPYHYLGKNHLLYDLVYNPSLTLFLRKGAETGARIRTGEEMFLKQADLSFSLFIR
jgi:shikimate dehydrogenase